LNPLSTLPGGIPQVRDLGGVGFNGGVQPKKEKENERHARQFPRRE